MKESYRNRLIVGISLFLTLPLINFFVERKVETYHDEFISSKADEIVFMEGLHTISISDDEIIKRVEDVVKNVESIEWKPAGMSDMMFDLEFNSGDNTYRVNIHKNIGSKSFYVLHDNVSMHYIATDENNYLDTLYEDINPN